MELVLDRFQATGGNIAGVHGGRQVDGDDQRRTVFQKVRPILFPGRPGGGDGAQHQQRTHQMHRTQALPVLRGDQQMRQQVRGDVAAQAPLQVLVAPPQQWQQCAEHCEQQPQGAQEMEVAEVDVHVRPPAVDGRASAVEAAGRPGDKARAGRWQRPAATRTDRVWAGG
ncbi:hypothetical protein D3C86_1210730 [compost metagenome]